MNDYLAYWQLGRACHRSPNLMTWASRAIGSDRLSACQGTSDRTCLKMEPRDGSDVVPIELPTDGSW